MLIFLVLTAWYEGCSGRNVGNLPVIWRVSKQAIFFKKIVLYRKIIGIFLKYLYTHF